MVWNFTMGWLTYSGIIKNIQEFHHGLANQSGFFIWFSPWYDWQSQQWQLICHWLLINQSDKWHVSLTVYLSAGCWYLHKYDCLSDCLWLHLLNLIFSAGLSTSVLVYWLATLYHCCTLLWKPRNYKLFKLHCIVFFSFTTSAPVKNALLL